METQFIIQKTKKEINAVCGKNLTLKSLKILMEKADNKNLAMMLIALVMGDPQTKNKATWNRISRLYLDTYRHEILSYYGYVCREEWSERIGVNNADELLSEFAGMKRSGLIGNCSYSLLANRIKTVFDLPYLEQTIVTKLKEAV